MITVDFNRLDIKTGSRILDIGCGSGRHTCAAYGFKNTVTIGVDLSHAALVEARDRLRFHDQLGKNGGGIWGLTMADVSALPFKDDFFDLVICSEVLEHIRNHPGLKDGSQSCGECPAFFAGAHLLGALIRIP
jgi:ubiquinone/menaquinone biosynthesis C-methylase UbiE